MSLYRRVDMNDNIYMSDRLRGTQSKNKLVYSDLVISVSLLQILRGGVLVDVRLVAYTSWNGVKLALAIGIWYYICLKRIQERSCDAYHPAGRKSQSVSGVGIK